MNRRLLVLTLSARVLVDDSLLAPFLRTKLAAGAALAGEAERKVAASLAALIAAASRP